MTRIVALADTHLYHEGLVVPDGDVLVHAGDMLQHGSLDELVRAAKFLGALPHRTKIVVAGNHEVCLEKRASEARAILEEHGLVYLEDSAATVDGLVFYGSPWTPKFRIWAFGAQRGEEMASKWRKMPDQVDVLVTHGPPLGYGDTVHWAGRTRRVGCPDLRTRVSEVKPRLHVFGHIHQDPGQWQSEGGTTTFANVTTDEGERPASIFDV
ncbi:hypothetical protein AKJ09_10881 [Labilithrix luteola]|uniref:Calcineurin-like phosphoesterase domain-containing protein n=1 Tax=Labilithrix luteola TaxID=1391654 RepID=A0A0K1QES6_9BACT|nr:metallophosphatase domain-containing protein [Labilithrix luteola]AKV04218.1 hypothetical protein AKJ09_10881 [Labilithrix luteola]